MLAWQNLNVEVRFGTEKSVGFPGLIATFESAETRHSNARDSSGRGALPHTFVELLEC